ncbi:MAG: hypothetical protein LBU73_05050 [Helicobacteraceae bacterium]|jgi:seryl-tRNA synthetase|nr:hypothetical protein [Helicobacteraceae bacterium]
MPIHSLHETKAKTNGERLLSLEEKFRAVIVALETNTEEIKELLAAQKETIRDHEHLSLAREEIKSIKNEVSEMKIKLVILITALSFFFSLFADRISGVLGFIK